MLRTIKYINLFFLFLVAPVSGLFYAFDQYDMVDAHANVSSLAIPTISVEEKIENLNQQINLSYSKAKEAKSEVKSVLGIAIAKDIEYQEQMHRIESLKNSSEQQKNKSDIVLEQILSNLLGDPIAVHSGQHSTIKIYTLVEAGYRGYMAKIKPHSSDALKLILAEDKIISDGESTSEAAERSGAILAVNAGGYMTLNNGKKTPLGTTIVDGKIKIFSNDPKLSFVGFNQDGHLVGGKYETESQLNKDHILQGSSFRPTLLENGKKIELTSDLATARHPRTIIGNFSNDELLIIVVDGRRSGWSSGVTLAELQDKLLSFKVKDAFNLDGGGSSALYFDGKVLNKPSDGKERKVTSNLVILP